MTPDEQEDLFTLISNSHHGRMDEQRCVLNATPQSTPKRHFSQSEIPQGQKTGIFFFFCI